MSASAGDVGIWVVILLLVFLCAGEPDLLDAIIAWVGRQQ